MRQAFSKDFAPVPPFYVAIVKKNSAKNSGATVLRIRGEWLESNHG
jgi:hypothetical protein